MDLGLETVHLSDVCPDHAIRHADDSGRVDDLFHVGARDPMAPLYHEEGLGTGPLAADFCRENLGPLRSN